MFVYFDRGAAGIERLVVNPYGSGDLHKAFADTTRRRSSRPASIPWQRLARTSGAQPPPKIAVNESPTFAFADGLTAWSKAQLVQALGPDWPRGWCPPNAWRSGGWSGGRQGDSSSTPDRGTHPRHRGGGILEARVKPGVTTIDDLAWRVRERIADSKLRPGSSPCSTSSGLRRAGREPACRPARRPAAVRHRHHLPRAGRRHPAGGLRAPAGRDRSAQGLRDALAAGNRLQDILVGEMKPGLSGNTILAAALSEARAAGLNPGSTPTHRLSRPRRRVADWAAGHAGRRARHGRLPAVPRHLLGHRARPPRRHPRVGRQEIQLALEEDAAFTAKGVTFLDGRQTALHLVRQP